MSCAGFVRLAVGVRVGQEWREGMGDETWNSDAPVAEG